MARASDRSGPPSTGRAREAHYLRFRVRNPNGRRLGNEVLSSPRGRRSSRPNTAREFGDPHRRGLSNR